VRHLGGAQHDRNPSVDYFFTALDRWTKFKRGKLRARRERDSDPIRKARSDAWPVPFTTSEQAIVATNAAELEVRKQLGMSLAIETSKLAIDGPDIFPSDARSIEHIPRLILDHERKTRSQDG
jgi:hypothetical protein